MNSSSIRALFLVSCITAFLVATTAQAVPVTFQVRMAHQVTLGNFDPAIDFTDLAGTFNGWGNTPLTPLTDADGDTIYEITLDGFTPAEQIEFKFRINGLWDGSEEFPGGGPNRVYTVQESGNLILVWYNDLPPTPEGGELYWWNDTVFYEILVRSFHDSDGDGIGDLQGLTQKLDYLNDGDPATDDDLGITGIWLMPINDAASYHGYDAVDYRAIDPDYGTMADFTTFLDAAHARGIKVIVDYVMNHCSNQHPWFIASGQNDPDYRDHFRWSPTDPGQPGWHWHSSGWYYGVFWGGMPDLNYETTAVKDEMFDTATYWLDTIGVDGFRLDAVMGIIEEGDQTTHTASTLQFWQDYHTHVKAAKPNALSVGEAWSNTSLVLQYVIEDRLDICFEFEQSYAILDAAYWGDTSYLSYKANQVYEIYPHLQYGTFLTNHDQNRVLDILDNDEGKAKVAAGIYLTLPGVPFIYYGEEIGMVGSGAHENIRSPMQWTDGPNAGFTTGVPWQPLNGNYPAYNVLVEQQDPGSLFNWYRQLIHVRNRTAALRRGSHDPLGTSTPVVMAFVRRQARQTVLCLINSGPVSESGITLTGSASCLVPGTHTLINLLDHSDTFNITVSPSYEITGLSLAGHETAIYQFVSATGVGSANDVVPEVGLQLGQNYPNPFNPATTLEFEMATPGHIRLQVYDTTGRLVSVLVDETRESGRHQVAWDGRDAEGQNVAAGVYLYRLEWGGLTETRRMVLVR